MGLRVCGGVVCVFCPTTNVFPLSRLRKVPRSVDFVGYRVRIIGNILRGPARQAVRRHHVCVRRHPLRFFFFSRDVRRRVRMLKCLLGFSLMCSLFFMPFPISKGPGRRGATGSGHHGPIGFWRRVRHVRYQRSGRVGRISASLSTSFPDY